MNFLEFNKTVDLKLYGGTLEKLSIPTLYLGSWTKHLTLIDIASLDLSRVFEELPDLQTFFVKNVDSF